MTSKTCTVAFSVLVALLLCTAFADGQTTEKDGKIPWSLTVVVMDGIDQRVKAEIPVSEAVAFIEAHSRFKFTVRYVSAPGLHAYTPYKSVVDAKARHKRYEMRYAMMGWNLSPKLVESLPTSTSYLFLYRLFARKPIQAGSALPLQWGLIKGGKPRPYATVPTDQWYYQNTPQQGFRNWSAQILTHELVNTIQAKLEAKPYNCPQLLATQGLPGNRYEGERLTKISPACYEKLGANK